MGSLIAAAPLIIDIVRSVQGLFGRGNGDKKKAVALSLAAEKGITDSNVGDWVDLIAMLLKHLGMKDPSIPLPSGELLPGKTYPVLLQLVSIKPDGSIEANLKVDSSQ